MLNQFTDHIYDSFIVQLPSIAVIVLLIYLARRASKLLIGRVVRRTIRAGKYASAKEEKQREDTVISIIDTAIRAILWVLGILMIVGQFGVNIGPLLAGAGVAGVALGFGAQSMVKDYLAGLFIVGENQYRVGDVLQVNKEVAGIVERVTLRATVLRDLSGVVHYIPNGNINIATNMTMEYANVDLNIGVGYDTDIDKLEKLINKVGQQMFDDESWKGIALEAPHMFRVEDFGDSAIIVKVVCKTAPIQQWNVKSEILRRLKKAFDAEGVTIPYPQRVIHTETTKS